MPQVTDVDDQFGTHTPQADRLQNAIHDRGAFRRFKDILGRTPDELDRWFAIVRRTPARPSPRLARPTPDTSPDRAHCHLHRAARRHLAVSDGDS